MVLRDVDVALRRGERVHVAGPNGAGTSSLLRCLRGRVLGTAARLGVVPGGVLDAGATSPVELVVLDEPTNHLDLPAVEALQDALPGLDTALLLVTHDPALAVAATQVRSEVADGSVTRVW